MDPDEDLRMLRGMEDDDEGPHDLPMIRMAKEIGRLDSWRRHE